MAQVLKRGGAVMLGGGGGTTPSTYDKIVTANNYVDLRNSLESGAYSTVFIPNGTYTITDNIARPLAPHANCKLIVGQSRDGVIINANALSNITEVLYMHINLTVESVTISGASQGVMFQGHDSAQNLSYKGTCLNDCHVVGITTYAIYGFQNCICNNCSIDCNGFQARSGFNLCNKLSNCTVTNNAWFGFTGCEMLVKCVSNGNTYGYADCKHLSTCAGTQNTIAYHQCIDLCSCTATLNTTAYQACANVVACFEWASTTSYTNCTNIVSPYAITNAYSGTNTFWEGAPVGSLSRFSTPPNARWKRCDGSVLTQAGYPLLFAQIGLLPFFSSSQDIIMGNSITAFANINKNGSRLLCFGDANGGYSDDNGETWTHMAGDALSGGYNTSTAYSSTLSRWVLINQGGNVFSSDDNGATWTARGTPITGSLSAKVVWTGSIFLAGGGGSNLASSTDGITWTPVTTPFTTIITFTYRQSDSTLIVAGDSRYFRASIDMGATWSLSVLNVSISWPVFSLECIQQTGMFVFTVNTAQAVIGYSLDGLSWGLSMPLSQYTVNGFCKVYTHGSYAYFMEYSGGDILRMGSDCVLRPFFNTGASNIYTVGPMFCDGVDFWLSGQLGNDFKITKLICNYNIFTSFRLPSPVLDAGITYDTWIKGD